jgi:hypothetical protein
MSPTAPRSVVGGARYARMVCGSSAGAQRNSRRCIEQHYILCGPEVLTINPLPGVLLGEGHRERRDRHDGCQDERRGANDGNTLVSIDWPFLVASSFGSTGPVELVVQTHRQGR